MAYCQCMPSHLWFSKLSSDTREMHVDRSVRFQPWILLLDAHFLEIREAKIGFTFLVPQTITNNTHLEGGRHARQTSSKLEQNYQV